MAPSSRCRVCGGQGSFIPGLGTPGAAGSQPRPKFLPGTQRPPIPDADWGHQLSGSPRGPIRVDRCTKLSASRAPSATNFLGLHTERGPRRSGDGGGGRGGWASGAESSGKQWGEGLNAWARGWLGSLEIRILAQLPQLCDRRKLLRLRDFTVPVCKVPVTISASSGCGGIQENNAKMGRCSEFASQVGWSWMSPGGSGGSLAGGGCGPGLPNERPQCLELPSPSIPSVLFVQGGVHTLQWNGCQGHVYTGQLSEDYSWAGSLAPNRSDLAGLGWGGATA